MVRRQICDVGAQDGVFDDPGRTVHVQSDEVLHEVHENDSDVRVFPDVAEARHHAVAAVLRVREGLRVDDVYESRCPGAQTVVAFAGGVGGGDEGHLLASDELDHRRIEMVQHLIRVELGGTILGAVLGLKLALSRTTDLAHLHSPLPLGVIGRFTLRPTGSLC
ncbi:hypothetical protein Pd630_LPD03196 [Rhodococcus opacus PD630]|nr:hypothetical protein Pd630_LPD03196 [Rhodococcus opacus PD630]